MTTSDDKLIFEAYSNQSKSFNATNWVDFDDGGEGGWVIGLYDDTDPAPWDLGDKVYWLKRDTIYFGVVGDIIKDSNYADIAEVKDVTEIKYSDSATAEQALDLLDI